MLIIILVLIFALIMPADGKPKRRLKIDGLTGLMLAQQTFDALSTPYLLQKHGGMELNPIARGFANSYGKMAIFKALITYPLLKDTQRIKRENPKKYKRTMLVLNGLLAIATINNALAISRGMKAKR